MNTNKQTKKQKIYHHTKKNKHKVKVQHVLGVGGMGKGWKGGKVMISWRHFCVYCFYEVVDTMPSPEFHRSFSIGRTIFVLTLRMRSVVPIRGRPNQSTMSKYYPITTRLRNWIAYFASAVHANYLQTELLSMSYGTRDFQHSIRKAATKRWRLTITTNVRRLCKLLANCVFSLHGVRNSRFSTFNQNSSKKETTTHDRPCELRICSSWKWLI